MHTRGYPPLARQLLYGKDVQVVAGVAIGGLRLPKVKVAKKEETWIFRCIQWSWIRSDQLVKKDDDDDDDDKDDDDDDDDADDGWTMEDVVDVAQKNISIVRLTYFFLKHASEFIAIEWLICPQFGCCTIQRSWPLHFHCCVIWGKYQHRSSPRNVWLGGLIWICSMPCTLPKTNTRRSGPKRKSYTSSKPSDSGAVLVSGSVLLKHIYWLLILAFLIIHHNSWIRHPAFCFCQLKSVIVHLQDVPVDPVILAAHRTAPLSRLLRQAIEKLAGKDPAVGAWITLTSISNFQALSRCIFIFAMLLVSFWVQSVVRDVLSFSTFHSSLSGFLCLHPEGVASNSIKLGK